MSEGEGGGGEGGGGEGGGEGGSGGAALTQADIDAAVNTAISGLKSKNKELAAETKNFREQLKAWDGLEPDRVRSMLDKLEGDEELKLIAEGDHEGAWNKRLEKVTAKHQSQLDQYTSKASDLESKLEASERQVRDLIIDQQVVTAFIAEKGLDSAVPDVVLRAKSAFKIEEGVPIARDSDGEIIRGADGAITIKEWVAARKSDAAHWFPPSQGAGAHGAGHGGSGAGGSIDGQKQAAASAGDMAEYRRLYNKKRAKGSE
jgi:hypothetical protein